MAKARSPRTKTAAKPRASRRGSRAAWVRKSVVVDQRKLDVAMRVYGVATAREAIDKALDLAAFYQELSDGIDAVSRAGGIDDIWKRR
jgi:hypothetical protein